MNELNFTLKNTAKVALAALLFVAFGTSVSAQKNIHFGLKAVPGLYWVKSSTDGAQSDGAGFGFGYGAMLEFGLTENYYIVTGVDIVSASTKLKQDFITPTNTVVYQGQSTIQYLQVPLFLKLKTQSIGAIKYFGQFGLGTGFALNAKNKYDVITTDNTGTKTVSTSDSNKDEVFFLREALLIGLGLEYNLAGSTSIVAGVTYDNGFTPVLKDKSTNAKLTSKGITLTVGILF